MCICRRHSSVALVRVRVPIRNFFFVYALAQARQTYGTYSTSLRLLYEWGGGSDAPSLPSSTYGSTCYESYMAPRWHQDGTTGTKMAPQQAMHGTSSGRMEESVGGARMVRRGESVGGARMVRRGESGRLFGRCPRRGHLGGEGLRPSPPYISPATVSEESMT